MLGKILKSVLTLKKHPLTRITIIIISLFLSSCMFHFKEKDLLTYNIYNVNKILIFKNKIGDLDTFIISSKTIINKGWDENTGWYNPPIANVTFKDLPYNKYGLTVIRWATADTIIQDQSLITIYKDQPNAEVEEIIGFKGFIGTIDCRNQKINELDSLNLDVIFKVPSFDLTTVRDSTEITNIYWSDKFGIVGYDYKNGDHWKLKN